MPRRVVKPHPTIGWSEDARSVVAKAREKHRKDRRTVPFEIIKKNSLGLGKRFWKAAKYEALRPWRLLNPVHTFVVLPLRSASAIIGTIAGTWFELIAKRRASLAMRLAAINIVAYSIRNEMQRDPSYKKAILDLSKARGLAWMSVNGKGEILLTKVERKYSIALEEVKKRTAPEYNVATTSGPYGTGRANVMVVLMGDDICVFDLTKRKDPKDKKDEREFIMPHRDMLRKEINPVPGFAGKKTVSITTHKGTQNFTFDKEAAEEMYKRLAR